MPYSLIFFAATAIVFVLQLIPFTGVLLMMMLAPFWSVILVNLGFVGIAFEAVTGRVKLYWLILPVAWFVGYFVMAHQSQGVVEGLRQELEATGDQRLSFAPGRDQIMVDIGVSDLNASDVAGRLVKEFDVSGAVFTRQNWSGKAQDLVFVRAPDAECARLQPAPGKEIERHFAIVERFGRARNGGETCVYRQVGQSQPRLVTISGKADSFTRGGVKVDRRTMTIRDVDGRETRVVGGVAHVLHRFPMPVVGCALISAGPKWSCTAEFWRHRIPIGAKDSVDALVQQVGARLALQRNTVAAAVRTEEQERETPKGQALEGLDVLDGFLKGRYGSTDKRIAKIAALNGFPEMWRDRIDAIANTWVASRETNQPATIPFEVDALLASASDADFRRVAPKIATALAKHPNKGCGYVVFATYARLGDLGAGVLPALTSAPRSKEGHLCATSLYMICRAGPSVAGGFANDVAAALNGAEFGSEAHLAAHNALLRLGRREQALAVPLSNDAKKDALYEKARRDIAPTSPPHVCGLGRGKEMLPGWAKVLRG